MVCTMIEEIHKYFIEQYKKAPFVMMPEHLPKDFKSKEDVDLWIKTHNRLIQIARQYKGWQVDDDDDF